MCTPHLQQPLTWRQQYLMLLLQCLLQLLRQWWRLAVHPPGQVLPGATRDILGAKRLTAAAAAGAQDPLLHCLVLAAAAADW
jgi:hypothetical protein